jgi:pSer/pThr/pTyr-binding forkhead associated (FHA) protein
MEVLLEIQTGDLAGRSIRVKPGQLVRLGRTGQADYVFPGDSHMSSVHFAVECDENGCRIYDCNSRNGTLVNGEKICATGGWLLRDGNQIIAGETRLAVRIETGKRGIAAAPAASPVPVNTPPEGMKSPEESKKEDRFLAMLSTQFQPLFAILDAAREPSVLKAIVESKAEYQSLFEGAPGAQLTHFAPHLASLPKASPLLEVLTRTAWGKSWGIFLTCGLGLADARAHLRQFLMLKQPEGKTAFFRFYDP